MCRVRGAAQRQDALLRERTGVPSHDASMDGIVTASSSLPASRRRSRANGNFLVDVGPYDPRITRHFSRNIDPNKKGAVDKAMRAHQRSNVHQVKRTAKYLRDNGRIQTKIDLAALRSRPHSDTNLARAEQIEYKMAKQNFKLRTTTSLILGANKYPAILYLSHHFDEDGKKIRDNIPDRALLGKHIYTQKLAHEFPEAIDHSAGDQRHEVDQEYGLMSYRSVGTAIIKYDRKGVRHDCQYWAERGHPNRVRPSAALLGKSSAERDRIVHLTHSDWKIQDLITRYIKRFFPNEFRLLKIAFDRGHWASSDYNDKGYEGGIFFNRVTLWKSTARMHRDRKDYLYSPGDIVIFFSDAFYHSILPWAPLLKQPTDILTPGRVSWVLNTHTDILQKFLANDYEQWIYCGGGFRKGYK